MRSNGQLQYCICLSADWLLQFT